LHTPGELLPCKKLLQAHRAMACKHKKASKCRRKEVQNSAPPCARRQHGTQRGSKIRAAWWPSFSSLGLTRRAAFCSRERRARATQPETFPLDPPAPSPEPRPPERAPARQRARARWWQRRTGNAGTQGRRFGRRRQACYCASHKRFHVLRLSTARVETCPTYASAATFLQRACTPRCGRKRKISGTRTAKPRLACRKQLWPQREKNYGGTQHETQPE
jgi:hypothetical protein